VELGGDVVLLPPLRVFVLLLEDNGEDGMRATRRLIHERAASRAHRRAALQVSC
jgi:hypothetical protein